MSIAHTKFEQKKRRIRVNGIFYAIISSASFGFSPLFSLSLIAAGLSNFDVLSYRWGTAGLVLMIYAFCKRKTLKFSSFDEVWKVILLSALRSITSVTLLIGYANISSGIASTINFMYPVVVALCMMLFFGDRKSPIDIGAIGVSIFGVYLLASGDSLIIEGGNTSLGLICSIISALSFAAYYILMKQIKADKIEVVKFTTWMMILSAIYFIICAFIFDGKLTLVTDGQNWLYILGLGLWSTMVSNFTGVKAVRRIGPTMTSILGALQPLTAVVLGVLFLQEHLYLKSIIGITLILIAVTIVVMHQKK
ncbi:MAG: DMT family transporter [Bacteroidales bacterium]|nr:DMT family transporter [Bacteroidales bacterium]MBQ6689836.1 DMT family transporter [Bacteroidales bacterium]